MENSNIIKAKCEKCLAVYNIPKEKCPEGATAIKCKKCGSRILLEKKEASIISFICPKCNRKYRFEESKIPESVTTVKCKSCDQEISLAHLLSKGKTDTDVVCIKCGYKRTSHDDRLSSKESCPKCGLLYSRAKFFEFKKAMKKTELKPDAIQAGSDPETTFEESGFLTKKYLWLIALCVLVLGGIAFYWISDRSIENTLGMKFVSVLPGTFVVGSPEDETGRSADESQREVTIDEGFYIQTTETTRKQWRQLMMYDIPGVDFGCENCPVIEVTYRNVQSFIERLNRSDKEMIYRLPTEAEWEYACRANSSDPYFFGSDESLLEKYAWYASNSEGKSHPVAQKKPNDMNLFDMHGNVSEICSDLYDESSPTEAKVNQKTTSHVIRGGSWFDGPDRIRSASRDKLSDAAKSIRVGFRLVGKLKKK